MSNSFSISVKPEIAAVKTDTADIRTDVTAIHDTDLPAVETKIDVIDTTVDAIRAVDHAIIDGKLDTIDAEVEAVDTVVDAIKLKTDATPQNVRGTLTIGYVSTNESGYQDVLNITGHGKLISLIMICDDNADQVEVQVTIDGVDAKHLWHTGDMILQRCYFADDFENPAEISLENEPYVI
nr:hypothetical protein [Bacteroidota bacterium]